MNKKIIATLVTAVVLSPLARADETTIYGMIGAGVESVKASGGSTTQPSMMRVEDENSRIGFKGVENLGNGMSSIWQVESSLKNFAQGGVNDKGEGATFATRNTFVGLSDTQLGTLQMGNYDSAYKRLTTLDVGTNVMANTTADTNAASAVVTRGDQRLKNSVHYLTPVWRGFQFGASWGADETADGQQRVSLAGHYSNGPFIVALGYDHQGNTTNTLSATSGMSAAKTSTGAGTDYTKLAAGYTFSTGTWLGASFERANYATVGHLGTMTQNDWTVAATQAIGRASVKLSYNKLMGLSNAYIGGSDDWGAEQWVLGATYDLSKATQLFSYYTRLKNDRLQNADFAVAPIYTSGVGSSSAALAPGNTLSALGVGMRYTF
ncbi:MAG: porin [Paludibacterium sp.]|uniref:porin n=1 Tax=Paludibacterium sp. TaxID=1917523 RepID=UPI0025E1BDB3|nr:porin [Paludibacterium sp.]MBV8045655.1 porin [Paludibacterium sp.]MBV8649454.1 porin [Paludibacterium sp.]